MNTLDELKEVGYLVKIANFIRVNGFKNWHTTVLGSVTGVIGYLATVDWSKPLDPSTLIFPITAIVWGVLLKSETITGKPVESSK